MFLNTTGVFPMIIMNSYGAVIGACTVLVYRSSHFMLVTTIRGRSGLRVLQMKRQTHGKIQGPA